MIQNNRAYLEKKFGAWRNSRKFYSLIMLTSASSLLPLQPMYCQPLLIHQSKQGRGIEECKTSVQRALGHTPLARQNLVMKISLLSAPLNWYLVCALSCFTHSSDERRWWLILPDCLQMLHSQMPSSELRTALLTPSSVPACPLASSPSPFPASGVASFPDNVGPSTSL